MEPTRYCWEKAAPPGSSTYYALRFMPPAQRDALGALYAFTAEVGAVPDECSEPLVAHAKLDWWRAEVARLFERPETAQHPVSRALRPALSQYPLDRELFTEIIDGYAMDVDYNRYPRFADLRLYCYRVASVPALLATEVLGYVDRRSRRFAETIGLARRLTQIIAQVRGDALNGRVYIPEEDLDDYGITASDFLRPQTTAGVTELLAAQVERTRALFEQANEALPATDRYAQRSHLILAKLDLTLLEELAADGLRVTEHKLELTPLRKFWIAWRVNRRERGRRNRRGR